VSSAIDSLKRISPAVWLAGAAALLSIAALGGIAVNLDRLDIASFRDFDTLLRMSTALVSDDEALPTTLVDVDDKSLTAWSASGTPKDKLAALVERIRKASPRSIIVDIDLSAIEGRERDLALSAVLDSNTGQSPPLLLIKRIEFAPAGGAMAAARSPYDELVRREKNIRWVTALFQRGGDGIVRHMQPSLVSCDGPVRAAFIAAPLVVADIERQRSGGLRDAYALNASPSAAWEARCRSGSEQSRVEPGGERIRVPYLYDWHPGQMLTRPISGPSRLPDQLITVSADEALKPATSETPFADRYVVIGSTHSGSRDVHQTPLGSKPGAVILAGAVAAAPEIVGSRNWSQVHVGAIAVIVFLVLIPVATLLRGAASVLVLTLVMALLTLGLSTILSPTLALDILAMALALLGLYAFLLSALTIAKDIWSGGGWKVFFRWGSP
jgi:CHASE2 domain-containing sensor protein